MRDSSTALRHYGKTDAKSAACRIVWMHGYVRWLSL
jgi:hypothetical protein